MSPCLTAGDAIFDHVVKVVSAGVLHCKATITKKYLERKHVETMKIFYFLSYFRSLILAPVDDSCLQQLLWYLANGDFLFPSVRLHLLIGILM